MDLGEDSNTEPTAPPWEVTEALGHFGGFEVVGKTSPVSCPLYIFLEEILLALPFRSPDSRPYPLPCCLIGTHFFFKQKQNKINYYYF